MPDQASTPAPPATSREAVDRVADPPKDAKGNGVITPVEASLATEWFLSEEEQEVANKSIELNVGVSDPIWVPFKIQVVDRDEIRRIRQEATAVNREGVPEVNEMEANLRIAVEGLLDPNIKGDPKMRRVRGQEYLDPADALKARFAHKPGLIDQLSGKIVELSGYNDADVREIRAAGN